MAAHPYLTGIATGYSLWLVPDADAADSARVASVIGDTAAATRTPSFVPHVTLLAGVPLTAPLDAVTSACASIASCIAAMTVSLDRVEARPARFKCVFVHTSPSPSLHAAHATARQHLLPLCEAMAMPAACEYEPHVSILYASEEQVSRAERERIAADVTPHVAGVALSLSALQLWRTQGDVHEWECVASYPLTGGTH